MSSVLNREKKILCVALGILVISIVIFICFFTGGSNKNVGTKEELIFETLSNKKEVGKLTTLEDKNNNIYYKINYPVVGIKKIDELIKNKIDILKDNAKNSYIKEGKEIDVYYFIDYEIYMGIDKTLSLVLREKIENTKLSEVENIYTYLFDIDNGEEVSLDDIFSEGYNDVLTKYIYSNDEEKFKVVLKGDKIYLLLNGNFQEIEGIEEYLKIGREIDKDYSSDIKEDEWNLVNKEYVVLSDVVLYKDATVTSEVVGSVKKDEVVKVYRQNDKGWSMLLSSDGILYIESKNLEEKKEVIDEPDTSVDDGIRMYTTTDLNMRSEPKTKSDLLDVIKSGEEVIKIGDSAGWAQIKYNDKVGYVSKAHLTEIKIEKKEVKLNVPPQGHIDPSKPMVALTFDDGPSIKSTTRILDTLEKYNVHATFFDLGSLMLRYPDIVKREARLGEVGTHTYSHKNLNKLSEEELAEELRLSREAYQQVLGYEPKLLRPPYGNASANVRASISDMAIINWNVDSLDWKYRNKDLTLNEIDKFGNLDGKIILMHSIHNETADAVEVLVPDLLDRGYQVVSVSELAYYKGYTLETGTIYYDFK